MRSMIGIIICAYNMERYLDECLSSCLGGLSAEVGVVNNWCVDVTKVVYESFVKNKRIKSFREQKIYLS